MNPKQHPARGSSFLAWAIFGVVIVVGLASLVLFELNRDTAVGASWGTPGGPRAGILQLLRVFMLGLGLPLVSSALGALIVSRQPRHRIGWLLLLFGVVAAGNSLLGELTVYEWFTLVDHVGFAHVAAWVLNWSWVLVYTLLVLSLALFPDGHFLSRGWAIAVVTPWLLFTVTLLLAAAVEQPMSSAFGLPNPFIARHPAALYNGLFTVGVPLMPLMVVMAFAQVVARYRHSGPVERQQIKWLVAGLGAMVVLLTIGLLLAIAGLPNQWSAALGALLVEASPLLPLLAIGVAVLRYRLYDIDLVLRRTVSYALLSAVLLLVYFGSVTVLTGLFSRVTGQQSALAIVISTLLIAALFNPLRRRVQRWIDRRFFRSSYDAQKVLAEFALVARDETDLDALIGELVRVVQDTMQPENVSVWLRKKE